MTLAVQFVGGQVAFTPDNKVAFGCGTVRCIDNCIDGIAPQEFKVVIGTLSAGGCACELNGTYYLAYLSNCLWRLVPDPTLYICPDIPRNISQINLGISKVGAKYRIDVTMVTNPINWCENPHWYIEQDTPFDCMNLLNLELTWQLTWEPPTRCCSGTGTCLLSTAA